MRIRSRDEKGRGERSELIEKAPMRYKKKHKEGIGENEKGKWKKEETLEEKSGSERTSRRGNHFSSGCALDKREGRRIREESRRGREIQGLIKRGTSSTVGAP